VLGSGSGVVAGAGVGFGAGVTDGDLDAKLDDVGAGDAFELHVGLASRSGPKNLDTHLQ